MITTEELEALAVKADMEAKANTNKIEGYILSLVNHPSELVDHIDIYVTDGTIRNRLELSIEVKIQNRADNPKLNSDYFGFRISYACKYHWKTRTLEAPELRMDCGSSNLESKFENPGKIVGYSLMSNILNHETEFVALLNTVDHTALNDWYEANKQYDTAVAEQQKLERDKKLAETKENIKVGFEFSEKIDDNRQTTYKYKITKMTPKRCYLEVVETYHDSRYQLEDNKYVGTNYGTMTVTFTCYMDTETLIQRMAIDTLATTYFPLIQGKQVVERQFVTNYFAPESEE